MYRVLLVDGEPSSLRVTKEVLEQDLVLQVETCGTVSRAIDLLRMDRFDVVVSELEVQASSGLDLLRDLRQGRNDTAFVLYSSTEQTDVAVQVLKEDGDLYLAKGRDPSASAEALRQAVTRLARRARRDQMAWMTKAALDSSPTATLILDHRLEIHFANEAFLKLAGLSEAAEVVGKAIGTVVPLPAELRHELSRRMPRGEQWRVDTVLERTDGAIPIRLVTTSARLFPKSPSYIIADLHAVEDKQGGEEDARDSEARLRSMVEHSTEGLALVDEDGTIVEWNKALENITGRARHDVIGKPSWVVQELLALDGARQEEREQGLNAAITEILWSGHAPPLRRPAIVDIRSADGTVRRVQHDLFAVPTRKGFCVVVMVRDVTEELLAKKALEESESRLRGMVNRINVGVVLGDPKTHLIVDVNDAALDIIGVAREELIGKPHQGLILSTETGESLSTDPSRELRNIERTLVRRDGRTRTIIGSVSHVQLNGRGYLLESFFDISDRKRAEEMLRESENKFRDIFDSVSDAILIHDREGRILEANAASVKQLEYSHDDLVAMNLTDFAKREDGGTFPDLVKMAMEGGTALFKAAGRAKSGRMSFAEVHSRAFVYDGEPAILSVARDTSYLIRAERRLAEMENRFKDIVESMPEIVWEVDYLGTITYVNRRCEEVIGYTPEELLGLSIRDLYHFENDTMARRFRELSKDLKPFGPIERTVLHRDGHAVHLESSGVPIYDDGNFLGYRGVDRDISRRKRMERRLRQKEALLRSIIDRSPSGIYVLGSQANGILYFNQRFCEMWSLDRLEEGMRNGEVSHLDVIREMAPLIKDSSDFIIEWKDLQGHRKMETVTNQILTNDGRTIRRFSTPILGESKEYFGRLYIFQE